MTRTHANIDDGTPGGSVSVEAGLMDMLDGTQTKECERRTKGSHHNARRGGNNYPRQYGDHHLLGRNYHRIYQAGTGRLHPSVKVAPGSSPPPGAISADETIKFVGPRVRGA
jgi:hypothetical protein